MPKPQKGRKLTDEQRLDIARKVCEMYATDKYTIAACLSANGIESESTWRKWQEEIAEIAELYKGAIEKKEMMYRVNLKERARTGLEKSIEGYTVELEETEGEDFTDEHGQRRVRITKRKKRQVHFRGSVQAQIFALVNIDSETFKHRNSAEAEVPLDIETPFSLKVTIINPVAPITDENDISDED